MEPESVANTLCKRIIPCLDIRNGRVVKGVQFESIRDAGDPVELAAHYAASGADELVFLDITATIERRKTLLDLVDRVASVINIPFTVGGGIRTVDDVQDLLRAGADKVSVNSAAFRNPSLIHSISSRFGSQCLVVAIDARCDQLGNWTVHLDGGRTDTGFNVLNWAEQVVASGAGELLVTSMNDDGNQHGFAVDLIRLITDRVGVPVIASGGAGTMHDFELVFKHGLADAALAASIFHFNTITIPALKTYLTNVQIPVRI